MGPRLLCFAGGAALTAYFVNLGLLATPFFGSGAFLWATVFAAFLLSLACGHGVGDLLARIAGASNLDRAAPRLAVAGGLTAWISAYLLPEVCREVLNHNADWQLAPLLAMVGTSLIPGSLIAALVSSEVRARAAGSEDREPASAQAALRLTGLMSLGGVVGIFLCAKPLLRADEVDVFVFAYSVGAILAAVGAVLLSTIGRVVAAVGIGVLLVLSVQVPSEIQGQQFAVAMQKTWRENSVASVYYLRTVDTHQLSDAEIQERLRAAAAHQKHGVVLTCEMLDALGAVSVTGEGLCRSLELLLSPQSKPFILPMFQQIESVRADGKGLLYFQIKRKRGVEGAFFEIPGEKPGESVRFWFSDDFTIRMQKSPGVWKLEFGPVTTTPAGVLEFNDTKTTPMRILNVVAWVDASLLGIVIEDHPEQVAVKAVAQGDIGEVKVQDVIVMAKDRK